MALLRSKTFWSLSTAAATLVATHWYDSEQTSRAISAFCREAEAIGSHPHGDSQHLRKLTLVLRAGDVGQQKRLFRDYAVQILTKAGIDYQWIELEPGKEDEALMMETWIARLNNLPLPEKSGSVTVTPVSPAFFEDGIVALDAGSFQALLSGHPDLDALPSQPRLGLLSCSYPSQWYWRLFYAFNRRKLAQQIGQEAIVVARNHSVSVPLSTLLPSSSLRIRVNIFQ